MIFIQELKKNLQRSSSIFIEVLKNYAVKDVISNL